MGAPEFPQPRNNAAEVTFFWKSDSSFETPDLQTCQGEIPIPSIETAAQFAPPAKSWTMLAGVVRPKSRGRVYLSGPDPDDPMRIEANLLSHPDDIKAALAGVELCREIGNSQALRRFARREVMPGNLKGLELQTFIRAALSATGTRAARPGWAGMLRRLWTANSECTGSRIFGLQTRPSCPA